MVFARARHHGHEPFRDLEADTVMVVSPGGNLLLTCEPEATQYSCETIPLANHTSS